MDSVKKGAIEALKTCYDPELHIDLWSLGLVYSVSSSKGVVKVKMTLTTPFCPYAPAIIEEVEEKLMKVKGVKKVYVELSFDPPWQPSEELRAMLGI